MARLSARRPAEEPLGRVNVAPGAFGVMHGVPIASQEAICRRPDAIELWAGVKDTPLPVPASAFRTSWVVSEPTPVAAEYCFGSAVAGFPVATRAPRPTAARETNAAALARLVLRKFV